jgi:beta-lactam-binding protein with PASTA domain
MPSKAPSRANAASKSPSPEGASRPSLWRFAISRALWVNLLLAFLVLVLLLLLSIGRLKHYTDHNQAITVPDCRGLTLEQASTMLERKDLRWEVMDSFYDPAALPLSILGQFPDDGREVKKDRTIHLTVNRVNPVMVELPVKELEEKTLRSVQFTLQGLGFRIGELIYKPGLYDNQVLELRERGSEQALEAGVRLPKGSVLDLLVTDGYGNTRVAVPNLMGMRWSEAEFVLRANNLVEGRTVYAEGIQSAEDSTRARVYRQDPPSGEAAYIKEGSMINLWLGSDSLIQAMSRADSLVANPPDRP